MKTTVGTWLEHAEAIAKFKHRIKTGLVTVAGKPGDDIAPGTLISILKQAGLK